MSIDNPSKMRASSAVRHDDAAAAKAAGDGRSYVMSDASDTMNDAPDTDQIARMLTEKYGWDALPFARDRAARALAVGDHLALAAWRSVIAATQSLLQQIADA